MRVRPAEGKNFLQSAVLAAASFAVSGTLSVAATSVEARAIEELSLRTAFGSTVAVSVTAASAAPAIVEFSLFVCVLTGAGSAVSTVLAAGSTLRFFAARVLRCFTTARARSFTYGFAGVDVCEPFTTSGTYSQEMQASAAEARSIGAARRAVAMARIFRVTRASSDRAACPCLAPIISSSSSNSSQAAWGPGWPTRAKWPRVTGGSHNILS